MGELLASLPRELIGTIFTYACPPISGSHFKREAEHATRDEVHCPPALIISQVCRYWREVAYATPPMWSYLRIDVPRYPDESLEALISLWSTNAKEHPLTVSLELTRFASFKTAAMLLNEFRQLTQRVVKIRPTLDPERMPLRISVTPSGYPFVIEELTWSNQRMLESQNTQGLFCLHASLKLCILLNGHKNLGQYLVHLDLSDARRDILLTIGEAIEIVDIYSNLEFLSLNIGYPYGLEDSEPQRIRTLHNLKTLSLNSIAGTSPAAVLNALCAPGLCKISLNGFLSFSIDEAHDRDCLLKFVRRSQPPINSLELTQVRCSDFRLVQVLEFLSSYTDLDHLSLKNCVVDEGQLIKLIEQEEQEKSEWTSEDLKEYELMR